jgi:ATP adenylyltransferase/5',5'''-P-1,P-4-tetraphosphate phosphorylase II
MPRNLEAEVSHLMDNQLACWDLARNNYLGLKKVITREIVFEAGFKVVIQFNPGRIKSSAAKVDAASIQQRPCFLCSENLPDDQKSIDFSGQYQILVNPYPIFSKHLTIPSLMHTDQRIEGHFEALLLLAQQLREYVVFYNGPHCGASAPDHLHFQAGNRGFLPIETEYLTLKKTTCQAKDQCKVQAIDNYLRKVLVMTGADVSILTGWFNSIMAFLQDDPEPMVNLLAGHNGREWTVCIFPRSRHRPDHYFKQGDAQILLSPAAVDFAGVFITPREEDFHKLNKNLIGDIFNQVTLDENVWNALKNHLST